MGALIVGFILIGLVLFFGVAAWSVGDNHRPEASPTNEELKRIMSTDIGHYKVEAAIRQARRIGVGVLIHEGQIYSIVTKDSPKQGTKEFKAAHQQALDEKLRKHS